MFGAPRSGATSPHSQCSRSSSKRGSEAEKKPIVRKRKVVRVRATQSNISDRDLAVKRAARYMLAAGGDVMVFTGAGVSAESGIPTYRDPGGIWERYDQKAVGHIKGFIGSPQLCWRFEFDLWQLLKNVGPNSAHRGLAELEEAGIVSGVITQNVDGLHQSGGSKVVHELHGNEMRGICLRKTCRKTLDAIKVFQLLGWLDEDKQVLEDNVPEPPAPPKKAKAKTQKKQADDSDDASDCSSSVSVASTSSAATNLTSTPSSSGSSSSSSVDYQAHMDLPDRKVAKANAPRCPDCDGVIKPDAIYFGEELKKSVKKDCFALSRKSKSCLVIGSSCIVSPANKLPLLVRAQGGTIVEVNPKKTLMTPHTALHLKGSATDYVSDIVKVSRALVAARVAALAIIASSANFSIVPARVKKTKKVVRVKRSIVAPVLNLKKPATATKNPVSTRNRMRAAAARIATSRAEAKKTK